MFQEPKQWQEAECHTSLELPEPLSRGNGHSGLETCFLCAMFINFMKDEWVIAQPPPPFYISNAWKYLCYVHYRNATVKKSLFLLASLLMENLGKFLAVHHDTLLELHSKIVSQHSFKQQRKLATCFSGKIIIQWNIKWLYKNHPV